MDNKEKSRLKKLGVKLQPTHPVHSLKWFKNRIGKRIFRDPESCQCGVCTEIGRNGLIIRDEAHADYVCEIAATWANEGIFLNYRDRK